VEDAVKQAGNEAGFRRAAAQFMLPNGERARHADERFGQNEENRRQVQYTEMKTADDLPTADRANPGEFQAADNKRHEHQVDEQNGVGQPVYRPRCALKR